jgi:transposase
MKASTADLRQRVVAAVPRLVVAEQFQVSVPTIVRWLRRQRQLGSLQPSPRPGAPSVTMAALREHLLPLVQAHPDATLNEYRREFASQYGMEVSRSTMSRVILHDLGWTVKKRP